MHVKGNALLSAMWKLMIGRLLLFQCVKASVAGHCNS